MKYEMTEIKKAVAGYPGDVIRLLELAMEAENAVCMNIHARREFVMKSPLHEELLAVAAGRRHLIADGFSLRRADGSSPDDDN